MRWGLEPKGSANAVSGAVRCSVDLGPQEWLLSQFGHTLASWLRDVAAFTELFVSLWLFRS